MNMEGIVKFLRQGVALAVVGAGLAAVPGVTASATPASTRANDDKSVVQQMQASADGQTIVNKESATGKVGFIRARNGGDLLPSSSANPAAKTHAYFAKYAKAFGATPKQLVRDSVQKDRLGTTVNYVQQYQGIPVFGALLRAHVDKSGDLTSVNGEAVPDIDLSVNPAFSKADAKKRALATVRANPPTSESGQAADTSGLKAKDTRLVVYRTGLVRGTKGKSILAYQVEVTNNRNIRDMVFISAEYGKPVNRYSMIDNALYRILYEADADRNLTKVWEEGDDLPGTLNEDQASMVESTGEAYWFFRNLADRDSYDGHGARMLTINNDPAIQCPNANWNGTTTNYCDGVSSDDVVAHEWGHAYTEYTHGLIYQWQSGALNESYSDMWGETIDLINGRLDEGEGNLARKRPVGKCSTHSPAVPLLTINSPSDIAKDCLTGGASFGEQVTADGITSDVVLAEDADDDGGTTTDGCTAYTNAAEVEGKIVLVDRGLCPFVQKAQVATDAGAAALIIGNSDDAPIGMSGDAPDLVTTVSIGLTDRESIRTAVEGGETVNVTIKDASGERADSYRWLIGEKSEAFGGAIRDMWNPTCYGDPGKVTDAEYKCSTDDNGGVHGNSAVPNHGYALLVDGGTYNGTTVEGIGLDKAANIYFRAMETYQTPTSGFPDHANALEASCADLTGKAIYELSTKPNDRTRAGEEGKITASDCSQVTAMIKAVELRKEPVQCNFQPMLNEKAGSVCGNEFETNEVFAEDFEDGITDEWTQAEELGFPESHGYDWKTEYQAPKHDGGTAYGPDPVEGDCIPGSDDISSANSLISPEITIPDDGSTSPVLSFDHYMATEVGWDGGLVKLSVNGAEAEVIPTDAYLVNGPNGEMETEAAGNTNPLAGEEGFTGTDGGEVTGSWGTSQVDLSALGVKAGDVVQVEFVVGRDGCNGLDGWYVDNVEVTTCTEIVAAPTTTKIVAGKARAHRPLRVNVLVSSKDATPTGKVKVLSKGKVLAKGRLTNGKAKLRIRRKFVKRGRMRLNARYLGNKYFEPSRDSIVIRVRRR